MTNPLELSNNYWHWCKQRSIMFTHDVKKTQDKQSAK